MIVFFLRKDRLIDRSLMRLVVLPAFNGRGTPPTKTVLRGSSGREASRTKSASDNFHGLICTGLSWIKNGKCQSYFPWAVRYIFPTQGTIPWLSVTKRRDTIYLLLAYKSRSTAAQSSLPALWKTEGMRFLFIITVQRTRTQTHDNLLETRETHSLWAESKIYFQPCEASRPPMIRNDENWHWFPLLKLKKEVTTS